ncbi:hypothetical protein M3P05_12540 [Sansalvadorimonas sp. 2012CJ34-2]|uniref:Uncharacterized protein n=1 Tax=Parendozoicomonas callyspongiae TaxID=2942213 RepID=A0ABT0PH99_9GAMM|nr:hypothetical protein [Sansalvadorimonas sp. 2012CJ34-2]MCL6270752.1 hypothetical protein [Sansalvadorimonas sp. 2012CJ34-2]
MKKLLNGFVIRLLILLAFSPVVSAEQAKGVIEEIQICATGRTDWIRLLQFRIGDKWFSTLADYYGHSTGDVDNEVSSSMLFMAFSQNLTLDVRFSGGWGDYENACGIPRGNSFHAVRGDYLRITK